MKILKKLLSKKGQLSMEVGILIAAAVAVAAIAAYFYVKNVQNAATRSGAAVNQTTGVLNQTAVNYAQKIQNLS
ncbi:class III signal peptide-containing protein [Methanocaldococcus sp.]|uniref:class III signal peptide-containing protein n=1 Tax=Methanocaldococcus sp. TaxID=2152917 RepID=UPI00261D1970|nr:class III signal peptide-containing protein [Methanocaldococcus sp.]MCQ6254657.1 class III signal peptide-containing protein [Methanocaldococcus sp.]